MAGASMHEPPRAPRRPTVLRHGDDERIDDFYWLRERDNPEVRAHLEAENAYTAAVLQHTDELQEQIYGEILNRVQETDASAPVPFGDFEYFSRTLQGRQYEVHCRRRFARDGAAAPIDPLALPGRSADEEVLLDENALAEGHEFFALGAFEPSPTGQLLAYSTDTTGNERYTLRVRDLRTGADLPDEIADVSYGLAWAEDAATLFFTRPDAAMRPWQVWRHRLGTPVAADQLVFEEPDERFHVQLFRARAGTHIVIESESKLTTEVWLIDTADPLREPQLVAPREHGVEYHVEPHRRTDATVRLFVLTNADGAENSKLVTGALGTPPSGWTEVVAHSPDIRLADIDAFAGHLVVSERADGLSRLRVLALDPTGAPRDDHLVTPPDPVGAIWVGPNLEFATTTLRYAFTSLVVRPSAFDYDLTARTSLLVKQQPVPGYDEHDYESSREWATAPDGTRIPLSIVHRRGLRLDGSASAVLYGYGSYEVTMDPTFSTTRLSLLERGFVYAIAHIRGGGELGRHWYENGKLQHKRNTFTDFIACAEHLVARGYTTSARLGARGGSAGGLLMGAVVNLRPDLLRAAVAQVPFVDCLTTLLDESLPLTVTEWEEWGDPVTDPAMYEYIKSYSPYDNVARRAYPALLVTGGLYDSRVQYWEPAKWVAKLRVTKTDDYPLLLKTELDAGHGGPSGRYDAWREEAFVLAFLVDQLTGS